MTNELAALVAILAHNALPDAPGDGNIELNYTDEAQYDRAVDALDRLGMLTSEEVAVRDLSSGRQFERIKVGGMWLLSPVDHLTATKRMEAYDEPAPIMALAGLTPVEAPTPLRPVTTQVRHLTPLPAFYSGDPGDEHQDPPAA